jgi:Zn-dependent peptidase ImmA (M78 family)
MAMVRVSAARVASMLRNRNLSPDDLAERMGHVLDVRGMVARDSDVGFDELEALGSAFGRPWAYLLVDEPEAPPRAGQDHRTVANQRHGLSADLIPEIAAADRMIEDAVELFPGVTVTIPRIPLGVSVDPESAGQSVRAGLGVPVEKQLAASDEYAALRIWVAALHRQGIFVSQRRLRDPTVRAFSMLREGRAVVVVDTGDTAYARIFSLLHEYVHLAMKSAGVCDLDEHTAIERYCNAVAAAVLLPKALLAHETAWLWGEDDSEDDAHIRQLSRHFSVSQAAVLIRLRDLGTLREDLYEAIELRRQSRRGSATLGGTYYSAEINKVGRLFAHSVFDAYDAGAVDRQDVAALLGVGEHNVARYRATLAGGRPDS